MDDEELEVFREGLRRASLADSEYALEAALNELGWIDALADHRRVAVSILFELLGRAGAAPSALDTVLLDGLGAFTDDSTGVVLPSLGSWSPPGDLDGEVVTVRGVATSALRRRGRAVVIARRREGHEWFTIDPGDLEMRAVEGLDPAMGLLEVVGDRVGFQDSRPCASGEWDAAVAVGQLALAHQLVGTSRAMLELANEHARERIQFGRPITAFQAVRHRLADSLVAIEAADAALVSAWDGGSALAARVAKAVAGRSALLTIRQCQQVLAGMGFTTEHPFHRFLRRAIFLDQLLGDSRSLLIGVGEELLRARELPSPVPL
jgi:hypothetical protein